MVEAKKKIIRRKKVVKKKGNPMFSEPGWKGGPGRPPGCKNKPNSEEKNFAKIKADFLAAFSILGGPETLAAWAQKNNENQTQFYTWMHSWIPHEMELEMVKAQKAIENQSGMGGQQITIISQMPRLPEPETAQVIPINAEVSEVIPNVIPTQPTQAPLALLAGEELIEDGDV